LSDVHRIHLIAVCGTGMAALAGLLKAAGHQVSGSDADIFPPMSILLQRAGVPVSLGFNAANITPEIDHVVIGNAVRADNPEAVATLARGIPYSSMPQTLADFFLKERKPAVVAGTHGKTTTASLLAWVLAAAGRDPGMMIGGWVKNFDGNHRLGGSAHFVVEGDEYDTAFFDKGPKFLHYRPHHAILTSIEHDHADIYPDLAAVQKAFCQFVALLPRDGFLVAADDLIVREVARGAACEVETYGLDARANWSASAPVSEDGRLIFEVRHRGEKVGTVNSPLAGRHNLKNSLAVIALCHRLGVSWDAICDGIARFEGVKRRQEVVGTVRDIIVIDDFAHHPTAITETLAALRLRYPRRRLWAIFEPRSASSRRNTFQSAFIDAFSGADRTIIADVFAHEKVPGDLRLDPKKIVSDLTAAGHEAMFIPTATEIVATLATALSPGDVVCIMSSGGFGGIHSQLLTALGR